MTLLPSSLITPFPGITPPTKRARQPPFSLEPRVTTRGGKTLIRGFQMMLHPPGNHDEPKRPPEQVLSAAEPMNGPNMQSSVPLTSCAHPATRNRDVCRHFAASLPAESHARSYYRGSAPGTSQPPFWVPANRPGASLGPAQPRHYFRPE